MKSITLTNFKEEVKKYLSSSEAEVLAIRGKWGVGKTFTWQKLLYENKEHIAFEKYAYVSLFGINNIQSLETSIFRSMINKSTIGTPPDICTFEKNIEDLFRDNENKNPEKKRRYKLWQWIKRKSHYIDLIPKLNSFSGLIDTISFLSVKNAVICIDDFERRGSKLDSREVLGLVSMLKEQRHCKVILIYNEDELHDDNDYVAYREKVIDLEMPFNLTPEECINLFFSEKNPLKEELEGLFRNLGINNIRIAKKIEKLANILHKNLLNFEPEVLRQALHSLVLFSWSFYSKNNDFPEFSFLKSFNYGTLYIESNNDDKGKKWGEILREYKYYYTDSFDLIIADGVEQGYYDVDLLKQEAKKLSNNVKSQKSNESFIKAWEVFHNSFNDNVEDVISGLTDSFYQNYMNINPQNLSSTTCLIRELGQDKIASEMIDYYIEKRKKEKGLFLIEENPFYQDIKDEIIIKKFKEVAESQKEFRSLKEVLLDVSDLKGIGKHEEELLVETTVEEYFDLFKAVEGKDLDRIVKAGLSFGKIQNAKEDYQKIDSSVKTALTKIGKESILNAKRISKYGIEI